MTSNTDVKSEMCGCGHFPVRDSASVRRACSCIPVSRPRSVYRFRFLADRTNGRAYATVLRLSVCRRLSVT